MKSKIILFINCCVILLLNSCYKGQISPHFCKPPCIIKFKDPAYMNNVLVVDTGNTVFDLPGHTHCKCEPRPIYWELADGWYLVDWKSPADIYFVYNNDVKLLLDVTYDNYKDYIINDSCFSKSLRYMMDLDVKLNPELDIYANDIYEVTKISIEHLVDYLYPNGSSSYPTFESRGWDEVEKQKPIIYKNQISYHKDIDDYLYYGAGRKNRMS